MKATDNRVRAKKTKKPAVPALILLLVAVAGAAWLLPNLPEYRKKAQRNMVARAMRKVTASQERYHRKFGRYAPNLKELGHAVYSPMVGLRITRADQRCWRAEATYKRSPVLYSYDSCQPELKTLPGRR